MRATEMVVRLVEALVWPATVLVGLAVMRKELTALLRRVARLQYKDLAVDFEARVERLVEDLHLQAGAEKVDVEHGERPGSALLKEARGVVESAPAAAVLTAWSAVEDAIRAKVMQLAISADPPSSVSTFEFIQLLKRRDLLPASQADLLEELWRLRNEARAFLGEAAFQPTRDAALTYIEIAGASLDFVSSIGE